MVENKPMRTTAVQPISQLGARVQEHGRIRAGEKHGRAMRALKFWRFTSPDEEAIRQLAELYGGEPKPWSDPKANPPDQWEVKTTSASIRVFLPPEALSIWYELWSGGGCQRRCDGETVQMLTSDPDERYLEAPCVCNAKGVMECKPKTRLSLILPEIRFGGLWRMETSSWNAAEQLPAMEQMLSTLAMYGVLEARLVLTQQSTAGGSKKFVVPRLEFSASTEALLQGVAQVASLPSASAPAAPALAPGPASQPVATGTDWEDEALSGAQAEDIEVQSDSTQADDEIVDAEIIEFPASPPPAQEAISQSRLRLHAHALINEIAKAHKLKADDLRHGAVRTLTDGHTSSMNDCDEEMVQMLVEALEGVKARTRSLKVNEDGTVSMPKVKS